MTVYLSTDAFMHRWHISYGDAKGDLRAGEFGFDLPRDPDFLRQCYMDGNIMHMPHPINARSPYGSEKTAVLPPAVFRGKIKSAGVEAYRNIPPVYRTPSQTPKTPASKPNVDKAADITKKALPIAGAIAAAGAGAYILMRK